MYNSNYYIIIIILITLKINKQNDREIGYVVGIYSQIEHFIKFLGI